MKETRIDCEVMEMLTAEGFSGLFYRTLADRRKEDPRATNAEVFELLNKKYKETIGRTRYSSYESFQKVEKRKLRQ